MAEPKKHRKKTGRRKGKRCKDTKELIIAAVKALVLVTAIMEAYCVTQGIEVQKVGALVLLSL